VTSVIIYQKIILGITTFSQYVKELKPIWKFERLKNWKFFFPANPNGVADEWIMNP